jgi:hypothetical protein
MHFCTYVRVLKVTGPGSAVPPATAGTTEHWDNCSGSASSSHSKLFTTHQRYSEDNHHHPMKNLSNVSHPSNGKASIEPSLDEIIGETQSTCMSEPENKKKARRGTKKEGDSKIILPFPISLHNLLDDAERNGKDHIVAFFPNGKAFTILKPKEFTEELMPLYFKTKKIASFQRQLLLYGFKRIVQEDTKVAGYFHDYFIKGEKVLSLNITRSRQTTASNPAPVPDPLIQRQHQQPRVSPNNSSCGPTAVNNMVPAAGANGTPAFVPSMLNMWSLLPPNTMQSTGLSGTHLTSAPSNSLPPFGDSPLTNIYLQAALALQQQKMSVMSAASSSSNDMTNERMLVNAAVARAQFQERQRVEQAANAAAAKSAAALQSDAETQAAETLANIFSKNAQSSPQHDAEDEEQETQNIESV